MRSTTCTGSIAISARTGGQAQVRAGHSRRTDHFAGRAAADAGPIEEVFRLLAWQYDYILIDAGQINSVAVAALHGRHDVRGRES